MVSRVGCWMRLVPSPRPPLLICNHTRSILGPSLGGALARPHENCPTLFGADSIWTARPYLLPNLVYTAIISCSVVVGIFYLEETHAKKKNRRDPGLEAGRWILGKFYRYMDSKPPRSERAVNSDDVLSLLSDSEQSSGCCTTEGSPLLPSTPSPEPESSLDQDKENSASGSKPTAIKAFI